MNTKTKYDPARDRQHQNQFLKKGFLENSDYLVLPGKAYEYLKSIYGSDEDILRYAIELSPDNC